jgi:hypothetical protein
VKLSPEELQDEREIRDPKIRSLIRDGYQDFLSGKTRPIEQLFAARNSPARKRLCTFDQLPSLVPQALVS